MSSAAPPPGLEPARPGPQLEADYLVAVRVVARLSRLVERGLASVDLTLSQYRVLGLLAGGSVGASTLADRLAVSRPSVTGVVDGLVARGLVQRASQPGDRRQVVHTLTPEGRALLAGADCAAAARLEILADFFPDDARPQGVDALCAWRHALDRSLEVLDCPAPSPGRPPVASESATAIP
ncbi:MAG: MarR family winged helix-turn-helix transcriptional regulator [Acidimicrobiales bacterium]